MSIEIVILLDRSGSMSGSENDVVGGVNALLDQQRESGVQATVSMFLFDTVIKELYRHIPLQNAHLNKYDYNVRGGTALLDAIGHTINSMGNDYGKYMPSPDGVMFIVFTDGEENSSKSFSKYQISQLISRQEREWKWEFVYMGAHLNAFTEANSIGFKLCNTVGFGKTPEEFVYNYRNIGNLTTAYASSVGSTTND